MIREPHLTAQGHLTDEPKLSFTPNGTATATFNLACNPSYRDNAGNYINGEPVFFRCIAWRDLAENLAESYRKGDPILITGRMRARAWEDNEGQRHTVIEIHCDSVSVPLDRRIVRMTKVTREHGAAGNGENGK